MLLVSICGQLRQINKSLLRELMKLIVFMEFTSFKKIKFLKEYLFKKIEINNLNEISNKL